MQKIDELIQERARRATKVYQQCIENGDTPERAAWMADMDLSMGGTMVSPTLETIQIRAKERQLQELESYDWWMKKHPGACPECGGHDGMESWYRNELVALDEWATTLRWYKRAGNDECRYAPCSYCFTGDTTDYIAITYRDLVAWARDEDPMAADYEALGRERLTTARADSRDSAGI